MKYLFTILLIICCCLNLHAKWLETDYDFGTWHESEGLRYGSVRMVNDSSRPIIIRRVRSSCGCTKVNFPKNEIAPGDTAFIKFNYNPQGRPGKFSKNIQVWIDDSEVPDSISIHGTVIGSEVSLAKRYPYVANEFRMADSIVPLGIITTGQSQHSYISYYNHSKYTIQPSVNILPPHILPLKFTVPRSVAPGESFIIGIDLLTDMNTQMGHTSQPIEINVNDSHLIASVETNIQPPIRKYTLEQIKDAPIASITPSSINIGLISQNKKVKFSFDITNKGKSSLKLYRIYSTFKGIKISKHPTEISPGKSCKIKCELNNSPINDKIFREKIEIISSDIHHPTQTIEIIGKLL